MKRLPLHDSTVLYKYKQEIENSVGRSLVHMRSNVWWQLKGQITCCCQTTPRITSSISKHAWSSINISISLVAAPDIKEEDKSTRDRLIGDRQG